MPFEDFVEGFLFVFLFCLGALCFFSLPVGTEDSSSNVSHFAVGSSVRVCTQCFYYCSKLTVNKYNKSM